MPTDENGIGFHTRWLRPNEASLIAYLAYLIIRSLTMDLGKYLGEYLINLSVRILWKRVEVGKDRPYRHSLFYFSEYVILVSILKWIVSPISSRFDSCLASVPPLGMSLLTINTAPLTLPQTVLSPLMPLLVLCPLESILLPHFSASHSYPSHTTQSSFLSFSLPPELGAPTSRIYSSCIKMSC